MAMSGSKMREWLDELLFPLQGKVDVATLSGIRTDIEKTVSGLRKELKSALEANQGLAEAAKTRSDEIGRLKMELQQKEVDTQSLTTRISGMHTKVTEQAKDIEKVVDECKKISDLYNPRIDLANFNPENVRKKADEIAEAVTWQVDGKAIPLDMLLRACFAGAGLVTWSQSLLQWSLRIEGADTLRVLFLGFDPVLFLNTVVNNIPVSQNSRTMRHLSNSAQPTKIEKQTYFSEGARRFINKNYDVNDPELYHHLGFELALGRLVIDDKFRIRLSNESTINRWLASNPNRGTHVNQAEDRREDRPPHANGSVRQESASGVQADQAVREKDDPGRREAGES